MYFGQVPPHDRSDCNILQFLSIYQPAFSLMFLDGLMILVQSYGRLLSGL